MCRREFYSRSLWMMIAIVKIVYFARVPDSEHIQHPDMPIYNKIVISSDFFQKSLGSVLITTKHLKKSFAFDIIDNIKLLIYPNIQGFPTYGEHTHNAKTRKNHLHDYPTPKRMDR